MGSLLGSAGPRQADVLAVPAIRSRSVQQDSGVDCLEPCQPRPFSQQDLADTARLIERRPELAAQVPGDVLNRLTH
jgi:hypothetical protein